MKMKTVVIAGAVLTIVALSRSAAEAGVVAAGHDSAITKDCREDQVVFA